MKQQAAIKNNQPDVAERIYQAAISAGFADKIKKPKCKIENNISLVENEEKKSQPMNAEKKEKTAFQQIDFTQEINLRATLEALQLLQADTSKFNTDKKLYDFYENSIRQMLANNVMTRKYDALAIILHPMLTHQLYPNLMIINASIKILFEENLFYEANILYQMGVNAGIADSHTYVLMLKEAKRKNNYLLAMNVYTTAMLIKQASLHVHNMMLYIAGQNGNMQLLKTIYKAMLLLGADAYTFNIMIEFSSRLGDYLFAKEVFNTALSKMKADDITLQFM
jgi:hypothetical protein